jgi:hypothetical protein
METPFEKVWIALQNSLQERRHIRNWTVTRGYTGKDFFAQAQRESVFCDPPGVMVNKKSFYQIWEVWDQYLAKNISRRALCDLPNYHTKYVISIFHQYLEK